MAKITVMIAPKRSSASLKETLCKHENDYSTIRLTTQDSRKPGSNQVAEDL